MHTQQPIPANSCISCTHLVRQPTLDADAIAVKMAEQRMYNCVFLPRWEFYGSSSLCSFTPSRHKTAISRTKPKPSGATP